MSKSASENYLDQLLNSVHDSEDHAQETQQPLNPQEKLEREIFGEPESNAQVTAKKEEEFLREFEEELLKDDMQEPFSDYKPKMIQEPEEVPTDTDMEVDTGDDLDFNFDFLSDQEQQSQPIDQLDQAVDAFDDKVQQEQKEEASATEQELPLTEAGEPDLAGNADSDLLDMLNNSENLSDLGDLLNGEEQGKNLDKEDSIGAFAQAQMDEQEQAADPEKNSLEEDMQQESKKKKRNKKEKVKKEKVPKEKKEGGILARLSKFFFAEPEEENITEITDTSGADVVTELTEENQMILDELEQADQKETSKKEKKKKEKKKKEPKQKKPKQKKPPKPKKEKKPKEVDNTPPLPKAPVIAIVVMIGSLFGLVLLGTHTLGYQSDINQAKQCLAQGNYVEGYENLQGRTVKAKDEELYGKLEVLATVSKKYQDYLVFDHNGSKEQAADALVCAYGRYDLNKERAEEYNCSKELDALGNKIKKTLKKEYKMSGKEALTIYNAKNREAYTRLLQEKIQ